MRTVRVLGGWLVCLGIFTGLIWMAGERNLRECIDAVTPMPIVKADGTPVPDDDPLIRRALARCHRFPLTDDPNPIFPMAP